MDIQKVSKQESDQKANTPTIQNKYILPSLIEEIAKKNGIKFEGHAGNWGKVLSFGDQKRMIYGFKFPVNTAGSALTCSDKPMASDFMKAAKIPHIRHRFFANPMLGDWAPEGGIFPAIHAYAKKHQYNLVCKLKDGTGGVDVFHVTTGRDLESTVLKIFGRMQDVAICAFKKIKHEYRVVILNQNVELIFRKVIPFVTGDGKSTLNQLIQDFIDKTDPKQTKKVIENIDPKLSTSREVLKPGEVVQLHWKHNLGQGATSELLGGSAYYKAKEIENEDAHIPLNSQLINLAKATAKALDANFVSVDIVEIEDEDKPNKKMRVMEVNSGVMMEGLIEQHKELGHKIATSIYDKVIRKLFMDQ